MLRERNGTCHQRDSSYLEEEWRKGRRRGGVHISNTYVESCSDRGQEDYEKYSFTAR